MREAGAPVAAQVRAAPGEAPVAALWRPRTFFLVLAGFAVGHILLRLAVSPVLTIDDSREAVFGQTLEWGYLPRQPPLYNWLVWGAFRLFGVGLLGLTVVKYALLVLAYAFLYLSGRRILPDARLAVLGAASLLLMIPIGWVVHADLTHSVAVLAAAAATFHALVRLAASGSPGAYLVLGLALGAGMLSKFSFALFAVALLVAGVTVPEFRARILDRRLLLSLAVAGILLVPYLVWFYGHEFSLARLYALEVRAELRTGYFRGLAEGLYYIVRVTLYYLAPLGIVLLVLFPEGWRSRAAADGPRATARRLLERFFLAEFGLLLAAALVGGLTYLKFRWMMPAFVLAPLYFFTRLDPARLDGARIQRLAAILLLFELGVATGFAATVYRGDRFGRPSRLNAPYDAVAAELGAAGFTSGTIVAGEGPIGGNLRLWFPRARVVTLESPSYVPPGFGRGQCLIVWERDRGVPRELREFAASVFGVDLGDVSSARLIETPYRFAPSRVLRVGYVLLPDGAARCR